MHSPWLQLGSKHSSTTAADYKSALFQARQFQGGDIITSQTTQKGVAW